MEDNGLQTKSTKRSFDEMEDIVLEEKETKYEEYLEEIRKVIKTRHDKKIPGLISNYLKKCIKLSPNGLDFIDNLEELYCEEKKKENL